MGSIESSKGRPEASHLEDMVYANNHRDSFLSNRPCDRALKLDRYGNPMIPQASDSPHDPLNWPYWKRAYLVVLVSSIAFMMQLGNAVINSAFVPMSAALHVTVQQTSYSTTTYILASGVFPMFLVPFANIWGRRPVYLLATAVHIAAEAGSGAAKSYGTLMLSRVFAGGGGGVALALAPATIADIFPLGERGLWTGFYVLLLNNGPHVAPIMGGFIATNVNWRWCYYVPAIVSGALYTLAFFTLRETLFSRVEGSQLESKSFASTLFPRGKVLNRNLKAMDFVRPFIMLRYLCVLIPACFFGTTNMFGSVLFAVTGAAIAKGVYRFNPAKTGLWLGVPLSVGCIVGELGAGWVTDYLTNVHARRHNGRHVPETRLWIAPFSLIMTAGIIGFGYAVQNKKPWYDTAVCSGIAGVGLQFASTSVYTYVLDCYKPESAECGAVLNLVKNGFSFTVGFFALPWAELSGYGPAYTGMAMINVVFLLLFLSFYHIGPKVRERQGEPDLHKDL